MNEMDSKAAARYLGIKQATLYAYVSRGLISSHRREGETKRRYYRKAELDQLKQRSDSHAGNAAAAGSALRWGAPVLDTAITQIRSIGPIYRGQAARELSRDRRFEWVAELLWGDQSPDLEPWEDTQSLPLDFDGLRPLDRMRLALAHVELEDVGRFSTSTEARKRAGRRLINALSRAWIDKPIAAIDDPALHAALIAIADHELNASTFAARVAASTGANVYACASAGFATLTGPRHGGSAELTELLIEQVAETGDAIEALQTRLRRGERITSFGHRLYSEGDPRWNMVVSRLDQRADPKIVDALDDLVEAADTLALSPPNVDLALAGLACAHRMETGSSSAIFALGRAAGWVAHALEQYEQDFMLRPRAHFTGSE